MRDMLRGHGRLGQLEGSSLREHFLRAAASRVAERLGSIVWTPSSLNSLSQSPLGGQSTFAVISTGEKPAELIHLRGLFGKRVRTRTNSEWLPRQQLWRWRRSWCTAMARRPSAPGRAQLLSIRCFSSGSAVRSCRREVILSFMKTLRRCHSTVFALMNNRAPISGFESPSRASRAT